MHDCKHILVQRSGLLGDTLVALPALAALRAGFPQAKITYLWQKQHGSKFVEAPEVLGQSKIIDEFLCDTVYSSRLRTLIARFFLLLQIRRRAIDLAIVLEADYWPSRKRIRFLSWCGAARILGPKGTSARIVRDKGGSLVRVQPLAHELLGELKPLGIPPISGMCSTEIFHVDKAVSKRVDDWRGAHNIPDKPLIIVAPWSNMPAKRWPLASYAALLRNLIEEFSVFPILLGARSERAHLRLLLNSCSCGVNAAGELSVPEGLALMSRSTLFLGNDSGIMHMAEAAGLPGVAIFAAIDNPGRWEPPSGRITVLRKNVSCSGCLLRQCVDEEMRCLDEISVQEVLDACRARLFPTGQRANAR